MIEKRLENGRGSRKNGDALFATATADYIENGVRNKCRPPDEACEYAGLEPSRMKERIHDQHTVPLANPYTRRPLNIRLNTGTMPQYRSLWPSRCS